MTSTRLRVLAIPVLVSIVFAVRSLGAIWGEPTASGAMRSSQSVEPPGKRQSDVSSPAITASAVNGVVNPTAYPGADLGEKINNVFGSGDGCAEVHIPPGKYVYATTIRIFKPCQSLLGAGSA